MIHLDTLDARAGTSPSQGAEVEDEWVLMRPHSDCKRNTVYFAGTTVGSNGNSFAASVARNSIQTAVVYRAGLERTILGDLSYLKTDTN